MYYQFDAINGGTKPAEFDKAKQAALGIDGREPATTAAVMRYTAGVVKRERERMARIFEEAGMDQVAARLRDESQDDLVFKWDGPEHDLDEPPVSMQERERQAAKGQLAG